MRSEQTLIQPPRFKISEKQWEVFMLTLMVLNGILPQIIPGFLVSPLFMGLEMVLMPFALLFFPIERQIKIFLTFAFLGYEYPLILGSIFFLLAFGAKVWKSNKMIVTRPLLFILGIVFYSILLFIVNAYNFFSFSGLMFWAMTFLGPFVLLLYMTQFRLAETVQDTIFGFFKKSIVIQFPILLAQALNMKTIIPGDWAGGSMLDAHNCGIFIGLYALHLILPKISSSATSAGWFSWSFLKKAIPTLCFLLLTDAKTVYFLLVISFLLFLLIILVKSFYKKYSFLPKGKIALYTLTGLFSLMLLPYLGQAYVRFAMNNPEADVYEIVGNYLLDDYHSFSEDHISNQKAVLYKRVFSSMRQEEELLWWVGTGPGTFGSRAANTLAYDVLYKETQKIPSFIPPVSSPWTRKYLGDLMTQDLVEIVLFRSAVLASPVSGIVALKAELGWPGFILFLLAILAFSFSLIPGKGNFLNRANSQMISIYWLLLPLLMIFDNYQEKPVITFPLILLTAVLLQSSYPGKK